MTETSLGWTIIPLEILRAVLQHINGSKEIPWEEEDDIVIKTFYDDFQYLQIEVKGHNGKNYLAHCFVFTESGAKNGLLSIFVTQKKGKSAERYFECLLRNNAFQPREIGEKDFMKKIQKAEQVAA